MIALIGSKMTSIHVKSGAENSCLAASNTLNNTIAQHLAHHNGLSTASIPWIVSQSGPGGQPPGRIFSVLGVQYCI